MIIILAFKYVMNLSNAVWKKETFIISVHMKECQTMSLIRIKLAMAKGRVVPVLNPLKTDFSIIHRHTICTSQETHHVSTTKPNR
jgi:hypothetical protein